MEDLEGIGIRVISQSRKELTTNTFDRAGSRLLDGSNLDFTRLTSLEILTVQLSE